MTGKDQINPHITLKEPCFDCTPDGKMVLRIDKNHIYQIERYDGENMTTSDCVEIESLVKKARNETDKSE